MFWTGTVRCLTCKREVGVTVKDWTNPGMGIISEEKRLEFNRWRELRVDKLGPPTVVIGHCGDCPTVVSFNRQLRLSRWVPWL